MIQRYLKLSIRSKLSFIVLVTSGVLIGFMATYFIVDKAISYRKNTVEKIETLAKVIGINSTAALAFDDPGTAKEILTALSAEPHVVAACIFSNNGAVFATYNKTGSTNEEKAAADNLTESITALTNQFAYKPKSIVFGLHNLDLSNPILLNNKAIGHVAIRADLSGLNDRLILFFLMIAVASAILFLGAHATCSRLQRFITEPLSDMIDTMNIVSSERDYSQRVTCQAQDELGILINSFNDMLSQIQDRDRELEKHKEHLEEIVSKRTSELQQSNDQLKKEIAERIHMQEELSRAQKMEAIGILAAGVAHDLNNILSGITSYPEILLANLPEESPLRKPLMTIHKTGIQAAAIVEDLLVLSRRSVAMVDIIQIEGLIGDYLTSPELEMALSSHPKIDFHTEFSSDLMPIAGSKIHLKKMVMNLVINAIEAMLAGGTINMKAENVYVDCPIKGYETVQEGDYVLIQISDTGTGIEPEIIDRIFEPFFTKKQLGRSGTGLGMAIVWGTVKDHKGYITVDSEVGQGTTFSIYLPVTRKTVKHDVVSPTNDYKGFGEFILVVDDSADQREIASLILTDLGYVVETVPSGEQAIEYVKGNRPDLILLDMIMAPGIDGLETYRQIKKINAGQRAVIASGYSESDHVRQAQTLGAGQYIRKPYTVQKIAAAIRGELGYHTQCTM